MTITMISVFLSACTATASVPTATSLAPPTLTLTTAPTSTETPKTTPTITSTPDPLAQFPEAQALVDQGMVWDSEQQVIYDEATGLLWGRVGQDGAWYSYPDGMVSIPAGDGSGAPPLTVPIYHNIQDALWGVTDELPWDDNSAYKMREEQKKANELIGSRYLKPAKVLAMEANDLTIEDLAPVREVTIATGDGQRAVIRTASFVLDDGKIIISILYASKDTDYYNKHLLVDGDAEEIYQALLSQSEEIYIPGPEEVRE
ncbi:MAG: hypothetical protein IT314_12900 [Anaerolineales bacterium]|nr:hypothetical protein [Anaerolineales bacterium]